jgi:hypothetical protein
MTTSDQLLETMQDPVAEVEVIKDLEQRGVRGLDTLSLEELQLLTERKRKQMHMEATERKGLLESEISSIDATIQQLSAKKVTLTEELNEVLKSLGLATGGSAAKRSPRKPKKSADTELPPAAE